MTKRDDLVIYRTESEPPIEPGWYYLQEFCEIEPTWVIAVYHDICEVRDTAGYTRTVLHSSGRWFGPVPTVIEG